MTIVMVVHHHHGNSDPTLFVTREAAEARVFELISDRDYEDFVDAAEREAELLSALSPNDPCTHEKAVADLRAFVRDKDLARATELFAQFTEQTFDIEELSLTGFGFKEFVSFVAGYLDENYPEEVFTGVSEDSGVFLVVMFREAIKKFHALLARQRKMEVRGGQEG